MLISSCNLISALPLMSCVTEVPSDKPRIFPERTSCAACGSVIVPATIKDPFEDSHEVDTDPTRLE